MWSVSTTVSAEHDLVAFVEWPPGFFAASCHTSNGCVVLFL